MKLRYYVNGDALAGVPFKTDAREMAQEGDLVQVVRPHGSLNDGEMLHVLARFPEGPQGRALKVIRLASGIEEIVPEHVVLRLGRFDKEAREEAHFTVTRPQPKAPAPHSSDKFSVRIIG